MKKRSEFSVAWKVVIILIGFISIVALITSVGNFNQLAPVLLSSTNLCKFLEGQCVNLGEQCRECTVNCYDFICQLICDYTVCDEYEEACHEYFQECLASP